MNLFCIAKNYLIHLWPRAFVLLGVVCLTGCGALWESAFPTPDPRERVTFHLASFQPQPDWTLHTAALGARPVYVQPKILMTGASIQAASVLVSRMQQYYVGVEVTPQAATQLRLGTTKITKDSALVILENRHLVGVMPLEETISGNQFAIPARSALAAQQLMDFLAPEQEGSRYR